MPINNLNVGKDVRIDLIGPTGAYVSTSLIKSFTSQQMTNSLETMPLNLPPIFAEIPKGWEGSFTLERADSTYDDLFALVEANYWAGQNIPSGTITETISDPSGAIHQYRYIGAVFKFSNAGSKTQDAFITLDVSFKASQRIKVS